jgi:hypothetical protein
MLIASLPDSDEIYLHIDLNLKLGKSSTTTATWKLPNSAGGLKSQVTKQYNGEDCGRSRVGREKTAISTNCGEKSEKGGNGGSCVGS